MTVLCTTMTSLNTTEAQFLHLLRCGVLQKKPDAGLFPVNGTDWPAIYAIATKQAVAGLVFWAVRNLPKEQQPPRREVFLPWLSDIESVCARNEKLNATCQRVQERFREVGFRTCILKGQGVAALYPDPLLRMPGDLDVWIWPEEVPLGKKRSLEERRAHTLLYIRSVSPEAEVVYHHADFNVLKAVPLEVHFTPSWMNSPCRNRWLQQWFEEQAGSVFNDNARKCGNHYNENENENENPREPGLCVPTADFNAVYLLLHIYRHLFHEGIGLRQIVDYYYALKALEIKNKKLQIKNNAAVLEPLRQLGLLRFCGALMHVMQELFGMSEALMLVPPREREGRKLLSEILAAGNFGHHDTRFKHYEDGTFGAFRTRSLRNLHFIGTYPSEVLWTPIWKIGQYFWRKRKGYL